MIHIQESISFEVIVSTKSSQFGMGGEHDGALRLCIHEAPEKGKANKSIISLLSDLLDVPQSNIIITSGKTNKRKRIEIQGIGKQYFLKRIGVNNES